MLKSGLKIERCRSRCKQFVFTLVHAPAEFLIKKAAQIEWVTAINPEKILKLREGRKYLDKSTFKDYKDDGIRNLYSSFRKWFSWFLRSKGPEGPMSVFEGVNLDMTPSNEDDVIYHHRFDSNDAKEGRYKISEDNVCKTMAQADRSFLVYDTLVKMRSESKVDNNPETVDTIQTNVKRTLYQKRYLEGKRG